MTPILVIDASPSIRETLRIVLGREHDVELAPSCELAGPGAPPVLVIMGLPPAPRDDRAIATALTRLAPDAPLLLLNAPADVDLRELAPPGRRVDFLPKPFDAQALRARVHALLAATTPRPTHAASEHHRQYLEYPFLPAATAAVARRAITTDLPVLLTGERGTGALEVGRALHFFGGKTGRFAVAVARRLEPGQLPRWLRRAAPAGSDGGTLYVEDVDETPLETQHELLALVKGHPSAEAGAPVRILASTTEDLEACAAAGRVLPELAYALGVFPLALAPLRERTGDIPALVERLTAALAARLRLEPVTYTAAALERLSRYLWFGNLAELEAVLGRTLAVHRPRVVEPEHLIFFPADAAASRGAGGPPAPPGAPLRDLAPAAGPNLEIVLGELAHELRNPMVTIKTFAQHLDSVLDDPEVRARFATLTSEAIARMDGLLETLLDFARFRTPIRQVTDLATIVERVLAERADELARKGVRVERGGAQASMVEVDEAQVVFALRSLLEGLVRVLVPHEPLRIGVSETGALELVVRTDRSVADRLAAYVEEGAEGLTGETPPLPFALATALVRRNGGTLELRSNEDGTTVITVALPRAGT